MTDLDFHTRFTSLGEVGADHQTEKSKYPTFILGTCCEGAGR